MNAILYKPLLLLIPLASVLLGSADPTDSASSASLCRPTTATAIIWGKTFYDVPAAKCDSGNLFLKLENYTSYQEAFGGVYYNGGYNCLYTRVKGSGYEFRTCQY